MSSDMLPDEMFENFTTYSKLTLVEPGSGITFGAPNKGVYIDSHMAESGEYTGIWKDAYGNQFTLQIGGPGGGGAQKPYGLFVPIQVSDYISETDGGGRFADCKAYLVF